MFMMYSCLRKANRFSFTSCKLIYCFWTFGDTFAFILLQIYDMFYAFIIGGALCNKKTVLLFDKWVVFL